MKNLASSFLFLSLMVSVAESQSQKTLAEDVDPFIGTGGHGHVYPGATRPFGMVQLSPDTRVAGWDACGGYHYSDSLILGFSHTHLSGTGIGDYGDILLMPTVGQLRTKRGDDMTAGYRSRFRHSTEKAWAGFYSVWLDDYDIGVELTATPRVGFHRYTFPDADSANIVLDLLHGIGPDRVLDAVIEFTSDREIVGYRRSKGWALDQLVYFVIQSSKPFRTHGVVQQGQLFWGSRRAQGDSIKAVVSFGTKKNEQVLLKVALSSASIVGARKNLETELPHWSFDRAKTEARDDWNGALGKIEVSGGTKAQRTIFYTALYRTMVVPNIFSDVDGAHRGMDKTIRVAQGYDRYTVFSLWDTFRAAHPLYTIIEPKRTVDFINTFLAQHDEGGLLPVWELAANETWCMIGYHSVSVIADAYAKNIRGFDSDKAFAAMKKSASQDHFGLKFCRLHGYISGEKESESVSKTLEYAYDDWTIAQLALALGKMDDYSEFAKRAQHWRNLYDPATGFFRGKRNGGWVQPFNPYAVTLDYTEANAWQYGFFVPHDVNGFMDAIGGRGKFGARLDSLFSVSTMLAGRQQSDITGLIGQYAHGNEPSHHMAYLYNYAGAPWKAQEIARRIMDELYTDKPDGLSGNEDCGQMSAWYVLSAMGFYQVNPGQPIYCLGSPIFDRVTINLENGRTFTVEAHNNSSRHKYVQSVQLNGAPHGKSYIAHSDIVNGAKLVFQMASQPNRRWATKPEDCPRSPDTTPFTAVPVILSSSMSFPDSMRVSIESVEPEVNLFYAIQSIDPKHGNQEPEWQKYSRPLTLRESAVVKAMSVKNGVSSFAVEASFRKFRRIGTITLATRYNPQYTAGGDDGLVDGLRGVEDFRVGAWQGYYGVDLEAVIDLGSVKSLKEIAATFLQDHNSWIFMPQNVQYEVSQDNVTFRKIFEGTTGVSPEQEGAIIRTVKAPVQTKARYVKVVAKNIGLCPPWHKGAGNKAWLFVDEIEVR